jgi:hypothetical protein
MTEGNVNISVGGENGVVREENAFSWLGAVYSGKLWWQKCFTSSY